MRSTVLLVALLGAASGFLPAPRPLARSNALHATTATETVKRAEFVDAIAEKSGLSKKDADAALTATLSTITESLAGGKKVTRPLRAFRLALALTRARSGSLSPSAHARAPFAMTRCRSLALDRSSRVPGPRARAGIPRRARRCRSPPPRPLASPRARSSRKRSTTRA